MAVPVGLAGTGRRASEVYAPALSACPDVDFVGVWGRSPEPVRQLAERYGAAPCERFEDLVERCRAVVFAVPPPVQAEYAERAARHGRGLLLEKPIGGDIAGAEELTSVAVREKVPTMVSLTWRFTDDVRRFLENDVPDVEPVGGTGRLLTGTHARGAATPTWRLARGVLRDQGPDLLDLLEAALGPIAGMHARGDPRGWTAMTLEHRVGRVSQATLYAGRTRGPDVAFVEVTGPKGTADVEAIGAVTPDSHRRMVAEFARAVSDGRSHQFDIEHGLHLQRLVESAETDLVLHG
ncbi:Gfo/Idh/MocA family protein [Geodermatophilus ruber]|uniref:Predicted dehydrogenase n=1 Tax=Geodermatophilus ruber TaxID=504800 RepID=A0A1I4JXJ4_9ACTN|nr:Gfo/Idh/MocA family oxidoreductase [Geodermatophilus ruber]SFL71260.1 Predicted dehydrogenase [Geodermatophilus ruber]